MASASKRRRGESINPSDVPDMVWAGDDEREGMSSEEESDLDYQLGYESEESR